MSDEKLKLRLAVREAPVINGFSYPFLRLMVSRLQELRHNNKLFSIDKDGSNTYHRVSGEIEALLNYVAEQMKKDVHIVRYSGIIDVDQVMTLIDDAESFLENFSEK